MGPTSFLLGIVCFLVHASAIAIVGYVPDYRFSGIDWNKVVSSTTHLILFSVEPRADGLRNLDVIRNVLQPQSPLSAALKKAGSDAPKVLVQNPDHLSLAKLVMMLRTAVGSRGGEKPIVTMTFHAVAAVLKNFASLTLKPQDAEKEMRFVDLFDMCHAMTYTMMDAQGRHTNEKMDRDVVQAWQKYALPLDRLTLGVPFFAVKSGVAPITFKDLVTEDRSIASSGSEWTKDGYFFVNAMNAVKKVKFAEEQGVAGLMIWELGQDAMEDNISLLRQIWNAAKNKGFIYELIGISPNEDHMFSFLTALMGGYYFLRVMQLAMKPSPQPLKSFPKAEAVAKEERNEEGKEDEEVEKVEKEDKKGS